MNTFENPTMAGGMPSPFAVQREVPSPVDEYLRNHELAYKIPSQPRILLPPPPVDADGVYTLAISRVNPDKFDQNGFANIEFLKSLTEEDYAYMHGKPSEWNYDDRRKAQQILPFLFLGPSSAARDKNFLRDQGITMVLAVRDVSSAQAMLLNPKAPRELGLQYTSIDVSGPQQLIGEFNLAVTAINNHMTNAYKAQCSAKVLVFCESGMERSSTVVAAYIMAMYSVGFLDALHTVQSRRFCVSFDDNYRLLLTTWDDILMAKREIVRQNCILQTQQPTSFGGNLEPAVVLERRSKRVLEETEGDEADENIDVANQEWQQQREGYSPFVDSRRG
jgi:serine/threonine/tyrosine-interacting protein